ncbi:MAG: hypothetical protein LC667_06105 [Thioalkalivibrio sp.]|nr:hypothetical protein [Thioalkalivibrio sp.]
MTFRLIALPIVIALAASALAQPAVFERQGEGDDFFAIELAEPAIVELRHEGASNFAVFAYPAEGRRDILVNEIGTYDGIRPLGWMELPIVDIEIQADGFWTFTVLPRTEAPQPGAYIEGVGDMVLNFAEIEGRALSLTHDGSSNFAVFAYPPEGRRDVLVNEIGAYSGRVRLVPGTSFVEIQADGRWTLAVE